MTYKELKKLYYGDQETYRTAYLQRFSSDNTVHLDFDVAGYQAFFVQCDDAIALTYRILKLDKEIFKLRTSLPKVASEQYSKRCLIDEIVITNNIEGVYSSRKEIGAALDILEEQSTKKGKKNVFLGLVNKYRKLLSHEQIQLQTCQDIRSIYDEIVLAEVVSENRHNAPDGQIFRKDMAEVYSATGKAIHKGKYPEKEIIASMEKALKFLNDESILPLYRICLFHYMIEYIHPFYDGNGRLGRFILSYCISENLERLLAYRISETIKENIKQYYDSFNTCNDTRNLADLTPFLIMMLTMIKASMEDLKESLEEKLFRWERCCTVIPKLDHHQNEEMALLYNVLIQASLFSEQGISTQELLSFFKTNYATLGKRLAVIKNQDLLKVEKHENKKYYSMKLKELDDIILA